MNPRPKSSTATIAAIFSAAVLFTTYEVVAQSPRSKTTTTWQDLGYNQLPEGFSTERNSLFEGLNEVRGTWAFDGEIADGEAATHLQGSLQIMGNPKRAWFRCGKWLGAGPLMIQAHDQLQRHGIARQNRL